MAHRLYFDVHVPGTAALQLRRRGVDVVRVQDFGGERFTDRQHLENALLDRRMLVMFDRDFLELAAEGLRAGLAMPTIILGHQRLPLRVLISDLELIAQTEPPLAVVNLVFYLPVR